MTVMRTELGCAGHFIASNSCRWRRHTQVGRYRVSSIGDYYPSGGQRKQIGLGEHAFFETMVFELEDGQEVGNEGCGCRAVKDWCELDSRRYATAGEAQAGHEALVQEYASKAEAEAA